MYEGRATAMRVQKITVDVYVPIHAAPKGGLP